MVIGMKTSVILVEKSLATLMAILIQLQSSHFFTKFHSNALLLGKVVLGGSENLYQSFITV